MAIAAIAIRDTIEIRKSPIVPIAIVSGGSGIRVRIAAEGIVVCNRPIWIAPVVRHDIGAAASEVTMHPSRIRCGLADN